MRIEEWRPRRRRCTGSRPTKPAASGTPLSTIRACCRTSRSTTSIASRGSSSGTRRHCPAWRSRATLPPTTAPAVAVLAGTAEVAARELDLPHLSRLLHLSAGVVRTTERPYATWLFRAAGSAGGRFPLEVYVAVPDGAPVPAGVHWYDPLDHALVQVGPPPRGDAPTLVVTGVPWRTGWRYRERGYRHVYWDAGTMLAQVLAAGRLRRAHRRAVHPLPGRRGRRARRRGRRARVAGGRRRPRRRRARARRDRPGRRRCRRRGAAGVPARHRRAAGRGPRRARARPGTAATRSTCRSTGPTRSRPSCSRAGRSAAWIAPAACPRACCARALPAALRGIEVPHFVVVHDVDGARAGRLPLARPVDAGPRRRAAGRALPGVPSSKGSRATRRSS